jgi:hypothetical protein
MTIGRIPLCVFLLGSHLFSQVSKTDGSTIELLKPLFLNYEGYTAEELMGLPGQEAIRSTVLEWLDNRDTYRQKQDWQERFFLGCIIAAGHLKEERSAAALFDIVESDRFHAVQRRAAAQAIGRLGLSGSHDRLLTLLRTADMREDGFRLTLFMVLSQVGDERILDQLRKYTRDEPYKHMKEHFQVMLERRAKQPVKK